VIQLVSTRQSKKAIASLSNCSGRSQVSDLLTRSLSFTLAVHHSSKLLPFGI
jgi:hypothetical protein